MNSRERQNGKKCMIQKCIRMQWNKVLRKKAPILRYLTQLLWKIHCFLGWRWWDGNYDWADTFLHILWNVRYFCLLAGGKWHHFITQGGLVLLNTDIGKVTLKQVWLKIYRRHTTSQQLPRYCLTWRVIYIILLASYFSAIMCLMLAHIGANIAWDLSKLVSGSIMLHRTVAKIYPFLLHDAICCGFISTIVMLLVSLLFVSSHCDDVQWYNEAHCN